MSPSESPLLPLPSAYGLIPLDSIIVPERLRTHDEDLDSSISSLVESIREIGLIQPIVLCDDGLTLLAGYTRLRALRVCGYTHAPFNLMGTVPPSTKLLMEYEENARRSSMSWQDSVRAIAKIHKMKVAESGAVGERWGNAQTGRLLSRSTGYVQNIVKINRCLSDPNIASAPTLKEAIRRLYESIADRAAAELSARNLSMETSSSILPPPPKPALRPSTSGVLLTVLPDPNIGPVSNLPLNTRGELAKVSLSERLYFGDSIKWMNEQVGKESFDLIFTDIPYGIDMENLDMDNIGDVAPEHGVDQNVEMMPEFLKAAWRVLKDKSYCLFFYDLSHHEKLLQFAKAAKFKVQPWPLHWIKTDPCSNRCPQYHWTKAVEHVMVLRKGSAIMRDTLYMPSHFAAGIRREQKMFKHPFVKPFDFCTWVLKKVAFPGMRALDPFAGEGSIVRAMIKNGVITYGAELSQTWYPRLVQTFKTAYEETYQQNVEFLP